MKAFKESGLVKVACMKAVPGQPFFTGRLVNEKLSRKVV